MSAASEFHGWVPVKFYWEGTIPKVRWYYVGDIPFTEPFFTDTIQRSYIHNKPRRDTDLATLRAVAEQSGEVKPAGFIYHWSRCGSTLVAQMLSTSPRHCVISEAPPVDEALRSQPTDSHTIPPVQRQDWLRWLLGVFAQPRIGPEQHLFVKFDCWDTLLFPLIHEAFPDVPWIFVYRNPIEILVSHQRLRGSQCVPGLIDPTLYGWSADTIHGMEQDEYAARVLAKIGEAALQYAKLGRGRLVNYEELPELMLPTLCDFFGLSLSESEVNAMRESTTRSAKNPTKTFQTDGRGKRAEASEKLQSLATEHLDSVYQRLEQARQAQ